MHHHLGYQNPVYQIPLHENHANMKREKGFIFSRSWRPSMHSLQEQMKPPSRAHTVLELWPFSGPLGLPDLPHMLSSQYRSFCCYPHPRLPASPAPHHTFSLCPLLPSYLHSSSFLPCILACAFHLQPHSLHGTTMPLTTTISFPCIRYLYFSAQITLLGLW